MNYIIKQLLKQQIINRNKITLLPPEALGFLFNDFRLIHTAVKDNYKNNNNHCKKCNSIHWTVSSEYATWVGFYYSVSLT